MIFRGDFPQKCRDACPYGTIRKHSYDKRIRDQLSLLSTKIEQIFNLGEALRSALVASLDGIDDLAILEIA